MASALSGFVYFPVCGDTAAWSCRARTAPEHEHVPSHLVPSCAQLCVSSSSDGTYLLSSSKGFNAVGAEARVRATAPPCSSLASVRVS